MKTDDEQLEQMLATMDMSALEELYVSMSDYDDTPVSIDEFIDSDRFLGGYFQGGMYPYWRQVLRDIYPTPYVSPYWLVCLRGSIGIGKTQIATTAIAYDLHRLQCLANPQAEFGLIQSTRILFAIFNMTLSLTHDVVWDRFSQMFASSPYFSRLMGPLASRRKRGEAMFPKNIDFFMGSRLGHALGKAVISGIIDEANFEIIDGQAYDTFNGLLRRMESRFMSPAGMPGKLWIVSSETDKASMMNRIVDSYRNRAGVYVSQAPLWDVKPKRYSGARFPVYKGSDARPAEIIAEGHKLFEQDPDNIIQVPVEHRDAFEADLNAALRDLAGVSTMSSYKLFRLRDRLAKASTVGQLFPDRFVLDFDDDQDQIANRALIENYFDRPLRPEMPRALHLDIALTGDRLGLAATYVSGFKTRTIRDESMREVEERVPETVTEWAIGIEPTPGKQIPLFKVRMFILWLAERGYPISKITADGYNSADFLQLMSRAGFDTEILSLDKTPNHYYNFRSAIYEGRNCIPPSPLLKFELENLEVSPDGRKIDHPKKVGNIMGSKDVADAVAGSVASAEIMSTKLSLIHSAELQAQAETHTMRKFAAQFWPDRS